MQMTITIPPTIAQESKALSSPRNRPGFCAHAVAEAKCTVSMPTATMQRAGGHRSFQTRNNRINSLMGPDYMAALRLVKAVQPHCGCGLP